MDKKFSSFMTLFAILCVLFIIAGCYEPTKEELRAFEQGVVSPEAESAGIKELKKMAGIPENAKISNVSRYGQETPRVVVYQTESTSQTPEVTTIKHFDPEGKQVESNNLIKPTSDPNPIVAKDEKGNITAYQAENIESGKIRPSEKVVFIDEKGKIESEKKLLNNLRKEGEVFTFSESEQAILSGNGDFLMLVYSKSEAKPESGQELIGGIKYQYVDRQGSVLWTLEGGRFGFDIAISNNGNVIAIYNPQGDPPHPSGLVRGINIVDKNGKKLFAYPFNQYLDFSRFYSLSDNGERIVVLIEDKSSGTWEGRYLHITVPEGKAYINDSAT